MNRKGKIIMGRQPMYQFIENHPRTWQNILSVYLHCIFQADYTDIEGCFRTSWDELVAELPLTKKQIRRSMSNLESMDYIKKSMVMFEGECVGLKVHVINYEQQHRKFKRADQRADLLPFQRQRAQEEPEAFENERADQRAGKY